MRFVKTGSRFTLALILVVFGLNQFLGFMPPPEAPEAGAAFLSALNDATYIFPVKAIVFLICAALLVAGRIPLAWLLLAPITVNILIYHVRYDIEGIIAGAVVAALQLVLFVCYAREFGPLFAAARRD